MFISVSESAENNCEKLLQTLKSGPVKVTGAFHNNLDQIL